MLVYTRRPYFEATSHARAPGSRMRFEVYPYDAIQSPERRWKRADIGAVATGTVAMATVLAEQATAAGVTISLKQVPPGTFFGPDYLRWTFSQDYYNYSPYLPQVAYSMLPGSPFNETHTDNPRYNGLYEQANATLDAAIRREIVYKMQEFDFTQGGYIIPAHVDSLDAYSDKISGYAAVKVGQPLSNFDFEHFWFV